MNVLDFNKLRKNLKKDFSNHKKLRVAVLGDSATQLYSWAIRGYGFEVGLDLEIFEADYDQIERQIFDASSELYRFAPDFIVIFYSAGKLLKKFSKLDLNAKPEFANEFLSQIEDVYSTLSASLKSKIIFFNFPEVNDGVFGNFANKTSYSFVYQLRKINYELMNLSQKLKNFFINDINLLQGEYGNDYLTDPQNYINSDTLFTIDFVPIIAKNTVDIIQSITGSFKKCLILDLDNTTWGGIIGDDGMENIQIGNLGIGKAFVDLQLWAKQLKQRGIILAVCSKNDEKIAKEPFEKHPDMVLKLEDIAIFVANWENKVDNIKYIQSILNIGFDSMVFLDDNPFERNIVRENIPGLTVPELPEDPAEYLIYLRKLNLFETASFTAEDEKRTLQYREEAKRTIVQKQFANEDEFLENLNMISLVEDFNKFNMPRVAQLTQRSNQFNLRTVRYTEEDIKNLADDNNSIRLAFSLGDKFGEYGLISVVILKKNGNDSYFIDTWIMSCRVLKRGMENFVLNTIVKEVKKKGSEKITGEYIPTLKNGIVENHYSNLGFNKVSDSEKGMWELNLNDYKELKTFIKNNTNGN